MLRSFRSRARSSDAIACPCCERPARSRTYRTRERRQWRRDQEA